MKLERHVIDKALRRTLKPFVETLDARVSRTLRAPAAPNAETSYNVRRFRAARELKALAVLSWFLGPEAGCLLRLDLEAVWLSELQDREILWALLRSKDTMLDYLETFADRNIFGFWVPLLTLTAKKLEFLDHVPPRAKELVRRRGYRDHGSCRPNSRWVETRDFSFDEEQADIEARRAFEQKVKAAIGSFGLLGVRLAALE